MEAVKRSYTVREEIWSSLIHGIGIALSLAGLIVLVTLAAQNGNVWVVVSTAIFGVSMVVLYTASTLYHAIPNPEIKLKLKKFDHISIYYLIAGTYTPFMLVNMRGSVGWTVFGIIWGLALVGTVLKLCTQGTLGIFFYVWKSRQYTHAVWHFFVLSGTVMHFFAVLYSCVLR